MRKTINTAAFFFFIWLVLDAFNVPSTLLLFLVVGQVPGTDITVPPTVMLTIMTFAIGVILFELGARRIEIIRYVRQQALAIMTRRERLPKRRFTRA